MGLFENQLKKFHKKTMEKYQKVRRISAFDLFSSIVLATPVDKGVLRGNWYASIGAPDYSTSPSADPSGAGTIAKIQYVLDGVDITNDIYMTNNLPYGPRIEYDGWSGKAPEGMVRVNVARWDKIVKNVAKRVAQGEDLL